MKKQINQTSKYVFLFSPVCNLVRYTNFSCLNVNKRNCGSRDAVAEYINTCSSYVSNYVVVMLLSNTCYEVILYDKLSQVFR